MFTNPKPKPKTKFKITDIIPPLRHIHFLAARNILQEVTTLDFGLIVPLDFHNSYYLEVSDLYDFEEVLNFLQSFKPN